jgi:hypothetical protein
MTIKMHKVWFDGDNLVTQEISEDQIYTYETYDMARFNIPEGLYSIEEVESMLATMKESKKRHDRMLEAAIQNYKEKNT